MPITMAWGFKMTERDLPYPAADASFVSQGKEITLTAYKGHKVMLWLFSTWCHTCAAGVKALTANQAIWERNDLVILAIKNHKNGGYPGPTIEAFVKRFGGDIAKTENWMLGEATQQMDMAYNRRKFPDIYFLIDEQGIVRQVGTAPAIALDRIRQFSTGL